MHHPTPVQLDRLRVVVERHGYLFRVFSDPFTLGKGSFIRCERADTGRTIAYPVIDGGWDTVIGEIERALANNPTE